MNREKEQAESAKACRRLDGPLREGGKPCLFCFDFYRIYVQTTNFYFLPLIGLDSIDFHSDLSLAFSISPAFSEF